MPTLRISRVCVPTPVSAAGTFASTVVASGGARLKDLGSETLIQVPVDETQDRVTELFDKYNLLTLPVVDEEGRLLVPASPSFTLKDQVKSVITVVAKVHHYWEIHAVVYGVE